VRVPVKVGWLTLPTGKDIVAIGHAVADDAGPAAGGRASRDAASLPRHSAGVASLPDQTYPHVPVSWRLESRASRSPFHFFFAKESPF
jgi:hypothetical protein